MWSDRQVETEDGGIVVVGCSRALAAALRPASVPGIVSEDVVLRTATLRTRVPHGSYLVVGLETDSLFATVRTLQLIDHHTHARNSTE